ncbi:LLM class flavin-dependent oxidoreductase [Catenuloplanes sp. NPDC051500]|uniref:LLM class flavin-dependent oxidoreductase n=1 Tax=Catenuloplanes sp. NPDC051500 TaxID=3363959 RepID=UPI00378B91E1
MTVTIGIGLPNQVLGVDPRIIAPWAAAAEQAGFASLGTVGRLAYPGVIDTVALAAAAGATRRIALLSGVAVGTAWPDVLFAKEVAGIDGVSGGRLTLGLGLGDRHRTDDFPLPGLGPRGLGARLDAALPVYRDVWDGKPIGGRDNPAVPPGTRRVPMMFGGTVPASFARMARWGAGYIAPSILPEFAAGLFDQARTAWADAGRDGAPRIAGLSYVVLGSDEEVERGRADVFHYYSYLGEQTAGWMASQVLTSAADVRRTISQAGDVGGDQLLFNPTIPDPAQIDRLAEAAGL